MTSRQQPHVVAPSKKTARVAMVYKNLAAAKGVSHIGLGVAALNTVRSLRADGYWADVVPANTADDIHEHLAISRADATNWSEHPISHVVISAPWVATADLQKLLFDWPDVHFSVVSHSNVGFLQADPGGIQRLREGLDLSLAHHNFTVAGNCEKFATAFSSMYGRDVAWLPNLYDVSTIRAVGQRVPWQPGAPLRIGVFGAVRPLKNMLTAAAACAELATSLRADVEVWTNAGRNEGGATVPDAIRQLLQNLPHVTVKQAGWATWPAFRSTVARMNVLINASYTESFNMVTADGIAEGVASAVGEAIDWVPRDWVANADDVSDVARVARRLVTDVRAVDEGQAALRSYVSRGLATWRTFLGQ